MSVKSHTIYILLDIHLCHTIKVKFLSHRYTKERFLRKPLFFLILIPTHEIINCKKNIIYKTFGNVSYRRDYQIWNSFLEVEK